MFGDPLMNSNFSIFKLEDICFKVTDGTHDTPKHVSKEKGLPFLTARNVRPFCLNFSDIKYISQKDHEKVIKRSFPEKGDILFYHIGANRGNAAEVEVDFEFSIKNVALFKPNKNIVLSKYLVTLLNTNRFREHIRKLSSGGAQKYMDLELLRSLKLSIPPIEIQRKFVTIFEKIMDIWKLQTISSLEIVNLYDSLLYNAFKGELMTEKYSERLKTTK